MPSSSTLRPSLPRCRRSPRPSRRPLPSKQYPANKHDSASLSESLSSSSNGGAELEDLNDSPGRFSWLSGEVLPGTRRGRSCPGRRLRNRGRAIPILVPPAPSEAKVDHSSEHGDEENAADDRDGNEDVGGGCGGWGVVLGRGEVAGDEQPTDRVVVFQLQALLLFWSEKRG